MERKNEKRERIVVYKYDRKWILEVLRVLLKINVKDHRQLPVLLFLKELKHGNCACFKKYVQYRRKSYVSFSKEYEKISGTFCVLILKSLKEF